MRVSNMKASVSSMCAGFELGVGGALEGLGVGAVARHAIVQAGSAGKKAFGLGVVFAVDEAHELVHHVAVKPGRAKGVLGDKPARGKDREVALAVPERAGRGETVKIDGSGWSKLTVLMVLKRAMSYM